jgi:putative endonuclease
MSFCVYILYSLGVDRYYVGQTTNLEGQLERHNRGKNSHTKSGIPWKLVYKEEFEQSREALERKSEIASSPSRDALQQQIVSDRNQMNG